MPNFEYQCLNDRGEMTSGVLIGVDRADVVRRLAERGQTATRVDAVGDDGKTRKVTARRSVPRAVSAPSARRRATGRPRIGRAELANFVRELATALEAGLPLMSALRVVRRQAQGKAMPVILDHLIDRTEAGDPLYAAARDYGLPFDDMVVGMLRAADASGEMSGVLHQLADLLERSVELRREVLGATFYPLIVAALVVISVIVLVTVLVPQLIEPLMQSASFELPWPTKVVLGVANFVTQWWLFIAGGGAVAWFAWVAWVSAPANRLILDRALLRAPLLGRLLRDVAVARFTRTLGTLSSAGLPILDALRITRNTLGNKALMAAVEAVEGQVTEGKPLAEPLERSGLFPPLLVQVVSLGERSGRLDSMLMHAAGAFDRQVNMTIKLFTKALPPLLLIFMAALGGFVLAAILLPLIELQNAFQ